ncbi:MAG: hypothetical protein WBA93_06375 [Microcoleaceae cyanobacterium]
MLFYLKIFISIITFISTVSDDLFWQKSTYNSVVINNQMIARSRRNRRPRRHRRLRRLRKERIKPIKPQQKKSTCSKKSDDLEILVADLMLDLPGYVNREIQRDRQPNQDYLKRNIVIAGRPEFEPLPIDYTPFLQEDINQIFLTTLERQYRDSQVIQVERFHWLFLRQNQTKWELVNMFSIEENLPLQPEDSSSGVFARGIRTWLQKCYFGDRSQELEAISR